MASWKKIITSGSNAELNHITSSGNFEITGNVSGSSTSTGSFGHIQTGTTGHAKLGYALVGDWPNTSTNAFFGNKDLDQSAVGNYALQQSTNGTTYLNTATSRDIHFRINNTTKMKLDSSGNLGVGHNISPTEKLDVAGNIKASGNISGSATSTGSFGRVEATTFVGDGSGLTGLTSAAIETYNTSGDNRILTSVNSSTVQGEAGLTFDGSELRVQGDIVAENFIVSSSVTHMTQSFSSGSTIFGDGNDDTHQFTGSLNISGSVNLDKNSHFQMIQPGGGIFKILTTGNQTSIEGGAITLTSGQSFKGTKFQTNEINTYSNGKDAIDIGEGYTGGIRWGYAF